MGILIDSNIIINVERKRSDLRQALGVVRDGECFLSVITVSELLYGLNRAHTSERRSERQVFLDTIFSRFQLLAIDEKTATVHSAIWADLASRGCVIGCHDLWIAATALRYGHELVTDNRREFERVPGLIIRSAS